MQTAELPTWEIFIGLTTAELQAFQRRRDIIRFGDIECKYELGQASTGV